MLLMGTGLAGLVGARRKNQSPCRIPANNPVLAAELYLPLHKKNGPEIPQPSDQRIRSRFSPTCMSKQSCRPA